MASSLLAQAYNEYCFTATEASGVRVPKTVKEALNSDRSDEWRKAIHAELQSMIDNEVWEVVPRSTVPQGRRVITSTWTFRVKQDPQGRITRFKGRLCARGFQQIPGQDYNRTHAPTARLTSFRALMARAAQRDYELKHADFHTAYLNGHLDEPIFMHVPAGFRAFAQQHPTAVPSGLNLDDCVLRLKKSIYGLKQAGRNWNRTLHSKLTSLGFERTDADPCLYKLKDQEVYLLLYVDDLIIGHVRGFDTTHILTELGNAFKIGSIEPLNYFLGFEVHRLRHRRYLRLSQRRYTLDILHRFGLRDCNPVATPAVPQGSNNRISDGTPLDQDAASLYRTMVGALLWLALGSRPDIAFAVSTLTRHMKSPTDRAMTAAKRVLRYLSGNTDASLHYNSNPCRLVGESDSSWANDLDSRRSFAGYIFSFSNGGAISWSSRLQRCVALSSTEAEYIGCCESGKEAVWLRKLANDLGVDTSEPTLIRQDNDGAKALTEDVVFHRRSKHIDTRYHYVRDLVNDKSVRFHHTPGTDLAADIFTKPLSKPALQRHLDTLFGQAIG